MLSYSNNWAEDRVLFRDRKERLRSIPAAWTSVAGRDPFVTLSKGRALFRPRDLLTLSALVRRLSGEAGTEPAGSSGGGVK